MEKPKKPGLSECCGGGSCCPCVWDLYYQRLEAWNNAQETGLVPCSSSTNDAQAANQAANGVSD